MTVLEKARLFCPDSNELDFQFMFNPDKVQFKEAIQVGESESARTESGRPKVSFEYPKARTLRLKKIMFDTYESGEDIMATYIDLLRPSVQFQGYSTGTSYLPRPPIYKFIWGDKDYITCFVEKLDYKLTMFLADGTPVRAEVNLSLKEVDDSFLSSEARTYDADLFGDRDTRTQPPEAISVSEANEYYLDELKTLCDSGTEAAEAKREEALQNYDPEGQVSLYKHSNKRGDSLSVGEGDYDRGDLGDVGNDNVTSLFVPAGYKLTLYRDSNFSGDTQTFTGEIYVDNLRDYGFNDRVSSFKVEVIDSAKDAYDSLMQEAEALESEAAAACDEYAERSTWYA
ncbi:MAG: hypothetical protein F6K00_16095 [Leptolyngbya sp. SIOISBB]|nr:hypothetical protein [Leptolyngbya sp. SIOISBB]